MLFLPRDDGVFIATRSSRRPNGHHCHLEPVSRRISLRYRKLAHHSTYDHTFASRLAASYHHSLSKADTIQPVPSSTCRLAITPTCQTVSRTIRAQKRQGRQTWTAARATIRRLAIRRLREAWAYLILAKAIVARKLVAGRIVMRQPSSPNRNPRQRTTKSVGI